ncbi:glycosyltransferase family 39 protein [bacterium]|nr:glycosyltransferase family 39 protein [bacterium]
MTKKTILLLIIVLLIASFFRLWQLNSIPPGLYPDEAINANDALHTLRTNSPRVFYPENNGREGLFINLVALSFLIFGASIWSLRIVSAIAGILTVFGLYLFTKELFSSSKIFKKSAESLALLSSFFLAVSFWHVNFSRIGFRGILVPLILVFSSYFLTKGFRTKKPLFFIISGIIFGLGFYTYIAFRLAVFLIAAVFFLEFFRNKEKKQLKQLFGLSLLFLLFIFITALPIGIYFINNPEYFVSRAAGVSIFSQPNLIKAFGESLLKHLAMFNIRGDGNWRHNIASQPVLFWPVGILFLIGLLYSMGAAIKSIKNKDYQELFPYCYLLNWWFIMLLPGILTHEGIPHSLRCIGAIPPVFVFSALGLFFIYNKTKLLVKINSWIRLIPVFALALLILSFVFAQYSRYFLIWGTSQEVKGAFCERFVEIGNYLNSLDNDIKIYVIVNEPGVPVPYPNGIPMPAQTPMFIESIKFGSPRASYLIPENIDKINPNSKKTIIVPMKYDKELFEVLIKKFPEGEIGIQIQENIWSYLINF